MATQLLLKAPGASVTVVAEQEKVTAKATNQKMHYIISKSFSDHLKKSFEVSLINTYTDKRGPVFFIFTREPSVPNSMGQGYCGAGYEDFLLLVKLEKRTFKLTDTDVYKFATALATAIKSQDRKNQSFIGLEFLSLWFKKLEIEFNIDLKIESEQMIQLLQNIDFQQAREIFSTLKIQQPVQYAEFLKSHKSHVLSYLKVKTDTPTLYEDGDNLIMKYILSGDDVQKANDLSVTRINEVYSFLPAYQRYCTDAIMLPFPSADLVSAVLQTAHKEMPPENITNNFDVHLNQIWISVISDNYKAASAYEWQSHLVEFRKVNLQYVRNISRYIESLIEGKREKAKIHAVQIDSTSRTLNLQYA
ncbi:MAG: hypothetical protein EOO20_27635, partial [Chryseobacterium sp.]